MAVYPPHIPAKGVCLHTHVSSVSARMQPLLNSHVSINVEIATSLVLQQGGKEGLLAAGRKGRLACNRGGKDGLLAQGWKEGLLAAGRKGRK
jgi:hypothetical protein